MNSFQVLLFLCFQTFLKPIIVFSSISTNLYLYRGFMWKMLWLWFENKQLLIRLGWKKEFFFKKSGPTLASFSFMFVLFHCNYSFNFNNINWRKRRWFTWDSNLGPQDCRQRWNHRAMVATQEERKSFSFSMRKQKILSLYSNESFTY